jgi:hypothetical protein
MDRARSLLFAGARFALDQKAERFGSNARKDREELAHFRRAADQTAEPRGGGKLGRRYPRVCFDGEERFSDAQDGAGAELGFDDTMVAEP